MRELLLRMFTLPLPRIGSLYPKSMPRSTHKALAKAGGSRGAYCRVQQAGSADVAAAWSSNA